MVFKVLFPVEFFLLVSVLETRENQKLVCFELPLIKDLFIPINFSSAFCLTVIEILQPFIPSFTLFPLGYLSSPKELHWNNCTLIPSYVNTRNENPKPRITSSIISLTIDDWEAFLIKPQDESLREKSKASCDLVFMRYSSLGLKLIHLLH